MAAHALEGNDRVMRALSYERLGLGTKLRQTLILEIIRQRRDAYLSEVAERA
jgi:hypothetical protein